MSTGTSQQSVAVQPAKSGRIVWLVAGAAMLSVLAALWLTYVVIEENGADLGDPRGWILILIVSLVPGLLAAWAVSLGVAATGRRSPSLALLAPVCVLVMMAAVAGMTLLGGRAYDARQATVAAACSPGQVTLLNEFAQYGGVFDPAVGQEDGTCAASLIYQGEDGQALMAALVGELTAAGWTTTDSAWDQKTLTRDGHAVQVTHTWSEEGETGIRIVALTGAAPDPASG